MSSSRESVLESVLPLVREAGRRILEVYRTDFEVEFKAAKDPVTAADRIANDYLCESLQKLHPGVCIVAEESDPETFTGFQSASEAFFVDPLDGTREFVARNDEFAVMVGFTENGRATVGAVYSPVSGITWAGAVDHAAFRMNAEQSRQPLRVRAGGGVGNATLLISRSQRSNRTEKAVQAFGFGKVQAVGSAGLKGSYVASGRADVYLSPGVTGKRWDACAIDALMDAAGGKLTDSYGRAIDYRAAELSNAHGLLCAYEPLHAQVLTRLDELRAGAQP